MPAAQIRIAVTVQSESELLHERVREFACNHTEAAAKFEEIALELARFQARWIPGFARLVEEGTGSLDRLETVPAVPCDAFRLARVAVHPPELDVVRFQTSGTTGRAGVHCLRTVETYRELSLRSAAPALTGGWRERPIVVALAPHPGRPAASSLGFMMRTFMEALDGRALKRDPTGAAFDPDDPGRWLAGASGVDILGLRRAALLARDRQEPLLVLATSLALVLLIEALSGTRLPVPKRTTVMQTGGFKGRAREVAPERLRAATARALRIDSQHIVGEYGMTELTSQLYERHCGPEGSAPGVYFEPPWLRVIPVNPATLEPVADGEAGVARIVDLGNVDSAVVVLTQDLVRRRDGGVELLGRRRGAAPRGCSLALEALVSAQAGWTHFARGR
jgi:hypothetical protein